MKTEFPKIYIHLRNIAHIKKWKSVELLAISELIDRLCEPSIFWYMSAVHASLESLHFCFVHTHVKFTL